ncbi:hypothetical protein B296_00005980 [Ensete ventricosum]|uniref:Uncharacterized protein n=1 Tax=Ensete ventricosum TaxID=4639 RepID=A0A427ACX9_ENSVE|nr:hypothetical protein B296_00005980 [Ensete ventricosum]
MYGPLHMILSLENQDLSLLDICHVEATFLFAFFPLEVSETTIPFGLFRLAEQLVPCSAPTNILARLRLFANTVSTTPFKKVLMLHGAEFQSPWDGHEHSIVRIQALP